MDTSPPRSPYDPPATPYPGMVAARFAQLQRDLADAEPEHSEHAGAPAELVERVSAAVTDRAEELIALSHEIHANPELGFGEHAAVATVARVLEAAGHAPEIGAFGLPTALRAVAGQGGPRVAILAEYDALPDIGHACGHNVICATAVGAYLAVAEAVDELGGAVELIGCPAEEGGGGKELIAREGGFDGIDAAVMLHPAGFDVAEHTWLGVQQVGVTYHGRAAHAAAMPYLGRNALDAVVAAYQGIAALRQHMLSSDRVHGIITDGGSRPNIVPDRASAQFYLRSADPATLAELSGRAREVFEAAALATGTRLETDWEPCPVYLPVRNNGALAARYAENVARRGRRALPPGVVPQEFTGSTDLGNVSVRVPAIHPTLAIAPPEVTIHAPEFAEWAASPRADEGTIDGAIGLALTAADFLADADLRADVAREFTEAGGRLDPDEVLDGTAGPRPQRGS